MIDNPQPDSGRSSSILLHYAKTALLYEELRSAIDGGHESMTHADALAEISAIRAENETLHAGYAAARLEIASLRAAQQPGAAGLAGALEDAQRAINSMKVEAETAAQGDEQMMLDACETISSEGLQADMAIRAALAAQGQAPAQGATADEVDVPHQCPYFGTSPHRDVWLAGWYAARAAHGGKPCA